MDRGVRIIRWFLLFVTRQKSETFSYTGEKAWRMFVFKVKTKRKLIRSTPSRNPIYLWRCWYRQAQSWQRACGVDRERPHCRLSGCTSQLHLQPQQVHPRSPRCYSHLCCGLLRELVHFVELWKNKRENRQNGSSEKTIAPILHF